MTTQELLQRAKGAKSAMALAGTQTKNKALLAMADALENLEMSTIGRGWSSIRRRF